MSLGTVTFFDGDRGFGFIRPDGNGPDLFAHARSLKGSLGQLRQGQRVRFDEQESRTRPGKYEAIAVALD